MNEYRILHIEDSLKDADIVKEILKDTGLNFQYMLIDNKEKFILGIKNFEPHVILCNPSLPQFDSKVAFKIYQEMNLEIAFLLVTNSVSEEYAIEMMKNGIDDYLLKENLFRLPQAIENAIAKKEKEKLRKSSEKKLEQSVALMDKAQQIAHIGSWESDIQANKEIWSLEVFRILGLSPEETQPSQEMILSFIHPEEISFVKKNVEQAHKELRDMSFYTKLVRKDGTIRNVYFESKFEFDKQGNAIRIQGIIHDLTEKLSADLAKEFERNNLSALINNTSDLMWSVDPDFKLITSNQAFDEIVKLIPEEFMVKNGKAFPVLSERQLSRFKKYYERAFAGESFTENEYYSSFWSEISFYPICKGHDVIGIACYSRNITERKKFEREILQKNKQLKGLTSHLQHVREEERATISREIHDELGQQLTALKMDIDWVMRKQSNTDDTTILKFQEMLQMSDTLIQTIRRISSDLRPAIIDDLGLMAAIEWKCNDFEEKMGIPCQFTSNVTERKFDNNFGINTYRILQESLTNISRHSKAKTVTVSINENEKELCMEISDDGKGIRAESLHNGKTLGIIGMKERAALLGGSLVIEGAKNKGTHTKLILPLKK